jgi:hypothetical protein
MNCSHFARVAAVAVLASLAACSEAGIVEPHSFQATDLSISATQSSDGAGDTGKIQICHRTNSVTNPYVLIAVANSAADGIAGEGEGQGDHYANPSHQGPIFDPEIHTHSSDDWGDIIPPMEGIHQGRNWTEEGQAIYDSGCKLGSEDPEPEAGEIQVAIELFPSANGIEFAFTGAVNTTLVSQDPTTPPFGQSVPPGTHLVTGPASASNGYTLTSITCFESIAPPPSSGDVGTATATFSVEPGEVVQCVFAYFQIG